MEKSTDTMRQDIKNQLFTLKNVGENKTSGKRAGFQTEEPPINEENNFTKRLNKDIESSNSCLAELINKMILLHEDILSKQGKQVAIITNPKEEDFSIKYHEKIFPNFLKSFLEHESYI